jgi:hypothetical protein
MASTPEKLVDLTSDSDDEVQCIGSGKLTFDWYIKFFVPFSKDLCPSVFLLHQFLDALAIVGLDSVYNVFAG